VISKRFGAFRYYFGEEATGQKISMIDAIIRPISKNILLG
jgi:hypothetical protein